jgi:hypothetical protein
MNRFNTGILLALSFLTGTVWAADGAPAETAANASSATPAAQSAPARATPAVARSLAGGPEASVRKLVCLNMSLQCFTVTPPPANARTLDLRAPDIRTLVSEAELRQRLDEPYEQFELQEQVQVEGTRPETYLPIGIASLPWAVMNPTQAWRIFLPIPPSQAK